MNLKKFSYNRKKISGKFVLLFLFAFYLTECESCFAKEKTEGPSVSADSAVLMCADSGRILYAKNENKERPMASTTKIMTALLTLESAEKNNREIKIDDTMVPVEGSSMYLKVGNVLTLESLAKGMLSVSGNDAANSAAIAIGGSVEGFVGMMNEKARQIGMLHTHFVTPSGLDKGDHHSTAYDMAVLGACAMENKMFYDIVSKRSVQVSFIEPKETRTLRNENRLLREYEGCVGIKTGFTSLAGRCLVSCAERNGVRLIAVTLNAPDDWKDHKTMFDYGFEKVESIEIGCDDVYVIDVVGGENNCMTVSPKSFSKVTIEKNFSPQIRKKIELPKFVYAPVREGELMGRVVYLLGDQEISSVDLFSKEQQDSCVVKKNFLKKILSFLGWGN